MKKSCSRIAEYQAHHERLRELNKGYEKDFVEDMSDVTKRFNDASSIAHLCWGVVGEEIPYLTSKK